MPNKNSNYPAPSADRTLNGRGFTGNTVSSLSELANKGIPQNEAELQERINDFFAFCGEHCLRPGVESLSLALGISRVTFWGWCRDDCGKGREWIQICRTARQLIIAFTEQATLSGHLAPPTGIFLMKNLGGYKDLISFEESASETPVTRHENNYELARKMGLKLTDNSGS